MKVRKELFPVFVLSLGAFAVVPPATSSPTSAAGEVKLPLAEYLSLLERIETAAASDRGPKDESFAQLLSQRLEVRVDGEEARYVARYQVQVQGPTPQPVSLPFAGRVESAEVEPLSGAALHRTGEATVVLAASKPGTYRVTLAGRRKLMEGGESWHLPLGEVPAAVASIELDLPRELAWECEGTVVVEESHNEGRRNLRLTPLETSPLSLNLYRELGEREAAAFARAVVVTLAELSAEGARRHDVVYYDVQRGELERLVVKLPAGLLPGEVGTDEGEADAVVADGVLSVARGTRLASSGYLYLTAPVSAGVLSLAPVEPAVETRARYLVTLSTVSAEVRPLPAEGWMMVDLEDLPAALKPSIEAMKPSSVWRRLGEGQGPSPTLEVQRLPDAPKREARIRRRESLSLLTVDGSLVHRELLTLEGAGGALDFELPPGGALWSASVDGVAVRPVERGDLRTLPLGFTSGPRVTVEIVTVEQRILPDGKSRLSMELPRLELPVLEHSWRLLLPESHRFRFDGGTLSPVDLRREVAAVGSRRAMEDTLQLTGTSTLRGRVTSNEVALPGAQIVATALALNAGRSATTDEWGRFTLRGLPAGRYEVTASLDGFSPEVRSIRISPGAATGVDFDLRVTTISEEIVVTAESATSVYSGPTRKELREAREGRAQDLFLNQSKDLAQGLAGGVKPLKVVLPERGKAVLLTGALPPSRVTVELQVKGR